MNTGIQEIKTAAKMREWSTLIAECRSSGKSVKVWCSVSIPPEIEHRHRAN